MSLKTSIKLGALILLGASGWFATSQLVAQIKTRSPLRNEAIQQAQAIGKATKTASNTVTGTPVKMDAHYHLDGLTVTPLAGGRIAVALKATIEDSRPNKPSCLWTVLIKDKSSDQMVAEVNYTNQLFTVKSGEKAAPTFNETFPLPPGQYNVEVRLYEVHPSNDLKAMNKRGPIQSQILLAANKDVVNL